MKPPKSQPGPPGVTRQAVGVRLSPGARIDFCRRTAGVSSHPFAAKASEAWDELATNEYGDAARLMLTDILEAARVASSHSVAMQVPSEGPRARRAMTDNGG